MKLILENVRGFSERVLIPIGNLTLLVGENSTGKSTILAMLQAALHPEFPFSENLFNRPPFALGSFDTIATYKGGKYGRAEEFEIGVQSKTKSRHTEVSARFKNDHGAPAVSYAKWIHNKNQLTLCKKENGRYTANMSYNAKNKQNTIEFEVTGNLEKPRTDRSLNLRAQLFDSIISQDITKGLPDTSVSEILSALIDLTTISDREFSNPISLAPLRSKPRRTYDEAKDEFKPEGDHIPILLSRMANESEEKNNKLISAMEKFGNSSNLFKTIKIKRLGKRPSDPFQLRVKGSGPDVNLVDVGYGVSQALPIIVDSILAEDAQMLLIQQPEVHLHPRAQAALGSFFANLVLTEKKQFVIETHSDYLVDRIRQEIARNSIKSSDVKILFTERSGSELKLHNIELDNMGNIVSPPDSYRSFFLEEELNLLLRGCETCQQ